MKHDVYVKVSDLFEQFARVADSLFLEDGEYTLPDDITPSALQLSLARAPLGVQQIFEQLSNIEGGLRELSNCQSSAHISQSTHRIRLAKNSIDATNNKLVEDLALILCFMFFSLGMSKRDNALRSHVQKMLLKRK